MAAISYTMHERARGVSGHTVGVQYSFDIELRKYSETSEMKKTQHVALDGKVETVLRGIFATFAVTIGPYSNSNHENVIEFLDSVAGGESFTFDPFGTVAAPDDPQTCRLSAQKINYQRLQHGTTPLRLASFVLRIQ